MKVKHRVACSCSECNPKGLFEYIFGVSYENWKDDGKDEYGVGRWDIIIVLIIFIVCYLAGGWLGLFLAMFILSMSHNG